MAVCELTQVYIFYSQLGGGGGVELDILRDLIEHIALDPVYVCGGADDDSGYQNLNLRRRPFGTTREEGLRMVGMACALHIYITKWGPHPINPMTIIYTIGGWRLVRNFDILEQLLPAKAALMRIWPTTLASDANLTAGSPLANLIIELLEGVTVSAFVSDLSSIKIPDFISIAKGGGGMFTWRLGRVYKYGVGVCCVRHPRSIPI